MNIQQASQYFLTVVSQGRRHKRYEEEKAYYETCRALMGGTEEQKEILRNYTAREDEQQREQRLRLTNSLTSSALAPSLAYIDEVGRVDNVRQIVEGNSQVKSRIEEHFKRFYRGESLIQYCFEAGKYATKLDPNYWTLFLYKTATDPVNGANIITDIYPYEVRSIDVVDYAYNEAGELLYLIFQSKAMGADRNGRTVDVPEFYMYGIGYVIHMVENMQGVTVQGIDDNYTVVSEGKKSYYQRVMPNSTREVPAHKWSAYMSDVHDNEIGEPIYAKAIPLLRSLICRGSFHDVHTVLHIRAEKFNYEKSCSHRDEESGAMCEGGYYGGIRSQDHLCKACHGAGIIRPSSEQSVISLQWPDRQEEIFDLSKLTHYAERPIGILEYYRKEIDLISRQISLTIFSQQNVDASSLANIQTATQSKIESDKVNNKLAPFAANIEKAWELAWRVAFNYYNQQAEQIRLAFPQDFKLQTLEELIATYQSAVSASLPYTILSAIKMDIMKKLYRNTPEVVLLAEAMEKHKPFKSKTAEEAAIILQGRAQDDPEKQLYEQWDNVATEIEENDPAFWLRPFDQQRQSVYELAARFAGGVVTAEVQGGDDAMAQLLEQLTGGGEPTEIVNN